MDSSKLDGSLPGDGPSVSKPRFRESRFFNAIRKSLRHALVLALLLSVFQRDGTAALADEVTVARVFNEAPKGWMAICEFYANTEFSVADVSMDQPSQPVPDRIISQRKNDVRIDMSFTGPDGMPVHFVEMHITDGMSSTIMIGERPPSADNWYGWWYAGYGQEASGSPDMLLGAREINDGANSSRPSRRSLAASRSRCNNGRGLDRSWGKHPCLP